MHKESGIRYYQGHLPAAFSYPFLKILTPQGRPTLHFIKNFLRRMPAIGASGSRADKQPARTVTFHIVIYSVSGRNGEELHTGIFPNLSVVFARYRAYAGLFHFIVNQDSIVRMGNTEFNVRAIWICRPVHRTNRLKSHFFFIQQSRHRFYRYICHTHFLDIQFFHCLIFGS